MRRLRGGEEEERNQAKRREANFLTPFFFKLRSSDAVQEVRRQFKELEKTQQITVRGIERQIEDGRSLGEQRAEDVKDRMRDLEKNLRQTEQRLADSTNKAKEEVRDARSEATMLHDRC